MGEKVGAGLSTGSPQSTSEQQLSSPTVDGAQRDEALISQRTRTSLTDRSHERAGASSQTIDLATLRENVSRTSKELATLSLSNPPDVERAQRLQSQLDGIFEKVLKSSELQPYQRELAVDLLVSISNQARNQVLVKVFADELNTVIEAGDLNKFNELVTKNSSLVDSVFGLNVAIAGIRESVARGDRSAKLDPALVDGLKFDIPSEKAVQIISRGSATERDALRLACATFSPDPIGSYAKRVQEVDPAFRSAVTELSSALAGFSLENRLASFASSSSGPGVALYERQKALVVAARSPDGASLEQWLEHLKGLTAGYGAARGLVHGLGISPEQRNAALQGLDKRFQSIGAELAPIFAGSVDFDQLKNAAASVEADVVVGRYSETIGGLVREQTMERLLHGESARYKELGEKLDTQRDALSKLPCLGGSAKESIQERVAAQLAQVEASSKSLATDQHARLIRAADEAHRAMSGSTDETALFSAVSGGYPNSVYSKEEIALLREIYKERHGEDLEERVRGELSGAELDLGVALLQSDKAAAVAAGMKLAFDCWWGRAGELEKVIDSADSPEMRRSIEEAFLSKYGKDYSGCKSLEDVIRLRLDDEVDSESALARFHHDKSRVAAVQITEHLDGFWGVDNGAVVSEIDKVLEAEIEKSGGVISSENLTAAVSRLSESFDRIKGAGAFNSAVEKLDPSVKAFVQSLGKGDLAAAQAARIRFGISGAGTDEEQVSKGFELPIAARQQIEALESNGMSSQAEEIRAFWHKVRVATEESYNQSYQSIDGSLLEALKGDLGSDDLKHVLALKEGGEIPSVLKLIEAIDGAGTDEKALRDLIIGKSKGEFDKLSEEYRQVTDGRILRDDLKSELSGDDEFDILYVADNGTPKTPEEQIKYVLCREKYETSGGFLSNSITLYAFKRAAGFVLGSEVDEALKGDTNLAHTVHVIGSRLLAGKLPQHVRDAQEMQRALAAVKSGKSVDAVAVQRAFSSASSSLDMFRATKNAAADTVANGATVVVAVAGTAVLVVGTGGAGTAAAVPLWGLALGTAGASAGARILVKDAIKGGSYGVEEFGTDIGMSAVDGVAAVTGAKLAMAGSSFLLEKIGAEALSRGAVFSAKFGRSIEEISQATLEGLTKAERAGISQVAGQAMIERSAVARFVSGSVNGSVVGSSYGAIQGAGYKAFDEHTWERGLTGAFGEIVESGLYGGGFGVAFGGALGGASGLWRGWSIRAADVVDEKVAQSILETGRAQSGRGMRVREFELSPTGRSHLESVKASHGSLTKGNVQDAIDMSVAAESRLSSRAERVLAREVAAGRIDRDVAARLQQRIADGKLTRFEANDILKRDPNSYVQQLRAPDPIRARVNTPRGAAQPEIPALMEGGPSGSRFVSTDGIEIIRPSTPVGATRARSGTVVDADLVQAPSTSRVAPDLATDMNETFRQFRAGYDRWKSAASDTERRAIGDELSVLRDKMYTIDDQIRSAYGVQNSSESAVDGMLRHCTGDDSFVRLMRREAQDGVATGAPKVAESGPKLEGPMSRSQVESAIRGPRSEPPIGSSEVPGAPTGYPVNPNPSSGRSWRDGGSVELTPSRSVGDQRVHNRVLVPEHAEVGASGSGPDLFSFGGKSSSGPIFTKPDVAPVVEPVTTRVSTRTAPPSAPKVEPQLQPQRARVAVAAERPKVAVLEREPDILDPGLAAQLRELGSVSSSTDDLTRLLNRTDDQMVVVQPRVTPSATTNSSLAASARTRTVPLVIDDTAQLVARVDPLTARAMVTGSSTSIMDQLSLSTNTALQHRPAPYSSPASSPQARPKPKQDDDSGVSSAGGTKRIEDEQRKKRVEEEIRRNKPEDPARSARNRRMRRDWENRQKGFFDQDSDAFAFAGSQKGEWIWKAD